MLLSWFPLFQPVWRSHFGSLWTWGCKEGVSVNDGRPNCTAGCSGAVCERWHEDRGSVVDPTKASLTFIQRERKAQRERKTLSVWSYVRLLLNFILWNIPPFFHCCYSNISLIVQSISIQLTLLASKSANKWSVHQTQSFYDFSIKAIISFKLRKEKSKQWRNRLAWFTEKHDSKIKRENQSMTRATLSSCDAQ